MRALSLTQPMAWAIFHGKDVENRTWPTKLRERVYIHASKRFDIDHYNLILQDSRDNLMLKGLLPLPDEYVHGALIGEVDIVGCRYFPADELPRLHSPWAMPGQYQFVLANPMAYDKPIPCKGMLKFFSPKFEPEKHKGR